MNSQKIARILRAVLAGDFDFEAPSHRTSSGVALFLAGLGAGVLVGMLFAPTSGEELRSEIGERTREGLDKARSKAQEFSSRQKPSREPSSPSAEKSAS